MSRHPIYLSLLLLAACQSDQKPAPGSGSSSGPVLPDTPAPVVSLHVNEGGRGMVGQLRWALAPDGSAIIAMEDWASIEAEPYLDGFFMGSERIQSWVREDSVWDAAPSPDWDQVAYGLATIVHAGEQETLSPDSLRAVAGRMALPLEAVQAAEFPASGMGPASGFARLARRDLRERSTRLYPVLAGWRVRWSPDGTTLYAGTGPRFAQDDSPPRAWIEVVDDRADTGLVMRPDTATVNWHEAITLDMSVTPDTTPPSISVVPGTIETRHGEIFVGEQRVGSGLAIAATRQACFILALVPDGQAGEYDPKWRPVIYERCGFTGQRAEERE